MKKIIFAIIAILPSLLASQQDVEEMMRRLQEATQKEIDQANQAVQAYIDKQDSLFAKFLEEDWKMFQAYQGNPLYTKPKPDQMPEAPPQPEPDLSGKPVGKIPAPQEFKPEEIKPEIKKPEIPRDEYAVPLEIDFYQLNLKLNYDKRFQACLTPPLDNKTISQFWETLSRIPHQEFIKQINHYRQELQLNDWGYLGLIHRIGRHIYGERENEATLFAWFFLAKSGYKTRVGYNKTQVLLLLPSQNMLYSTPFLTLGKHQYFMISFNGKGIGNNTIYTYEGSYPGAEQIINLQLRKLPRLKAAYDERKLDFVYRGNSYDIKVKYDPSLVQFFEFYPQTDYHIYFGTKASSPLRYSLLTSLGPIIENYSEAEAVNCLLRFVQTAFYYKTDQDHFGREKPLFPEETIHYPYSDCEDRSILFTFLVRELVGLEVIGLKYPGHMTTAVKFDAPLPGDQINYQNQTYMICDPTYINADVGQGMPRYKNENPEVIEIRI